MNWRERYRGLPFSREQVEEIGDLLGLQQHEQAFAAAQSIAVLVACYDYTYAAKKRMGPVDQVSTKLAQIAAAASTLAQLLKDETICDVPSMGLSEFATYEPKLKGLKRQPLWRDDTVLRAKVQELVADIAFSSDKLANNDRLMRGYYFIPPRHQANNNLETASIWPSLFMTWEQHDRQVAGSVGGTNKLHRFVNLVHDAFGLGKPSTNTLNRAIQRWKQDPRRDRVENSAWYFGNSGEETDAIGEA